MTHKFKNLNMRDADVWYYEDFFSDYHKIWYDMIDTSVDWQQFMVMVYGKHIPQPRDSFYMADNGYPYKYSGIDRKPEDWSVSVDEMKKILNQEIREVAPNHPDLNACLGNRYRNGQQYLSQHSDNEGDLVSNAFIVSVSLGAARDFIFTHKKTKEKVNILLTPGSVLLMGGDCQKNWKHGVPKRLKVKDPRINLTFRSIRMREE
jgi:alkylated DNA repair dioxygenase AlkB